MLEAILPQLNWGAKMSIPTLFKTFEGFAVWFSSCLPQPITAEKIFSAGYWEFCVGGRHANPTLLFFVIKQ